MISVNNRDLAGEYSFEVRETSDVNAANWFSTLVSVRVIDYCLDAVISVTSEEQNFIYVAGDPELAISLSSIE